MSKKSSSSNSTSKRSSLAKASISKMQGFFEDAQSSDEPEDDGDQISELREQLNGMVITVKALVKDNKKLVAKVTALEEKVSELEEENEDDDDENEDSHTTPVKAKVEKNDYALSPVNSTPVHDGYKPSGVITHKGENFILYTGPLGGYCYFKKTMSTDGTKGTQRMTANAKAMTTFKKL